MTSGGSPHSFETVMCAVLDETEESGWKNIHGEVFRFPPNKNLFCAFVGSGFQVSFSGISHCLEGSNTCLLACLLEPILNSNRASDTLSHTRFIERTQFPLVQHQEEVLFLSLVVLAISLLHPSSRVPLSEVTTAPSTVSWSCAATGAVNLHLCSSMCGSVLPIQQGRSVHSAHCAVRSDSGDCWLHGWLILQADGRAVLGPKHPADVCDILWAAVCSLLH